MSGPETLKWAHENRPKLDAMLVGSSTVVIDDPQLTARPGGELSERQPLRVVVDSTGRVPTTAKVLQGASKTLIATTQQSSEQWRRSMEDAGAEVLVLPAGSDDRVPLLSLLDELGRRGVVLLLCEGGGVLHGSLFDQRLVDKVTCVIAPHDRRLQSRRRRPSMASAPPTCARRCASVTSRSSAWATTSSFTGYPVWPEPAQG